MKYMSLTAYKAKRKFVGEGKTNEPAGKVTKKDSHIFVVHNHFSKNHHWDLRLEMDGVLKSWAVPKEPPLTKDVKRLAIQVEDHPLAYANFEGTIPTGNYGAGKVEIWDNGKYILKNKSANKIELNLKGKKLNGDYVLIKTHYGSKPDKSWLWFKI